MRQLTHMPLAASITAPALPVGARRRLSKLCVAIQGASPEGMIERAGAALKDAKFFEFRLDSLPKPATALPLLNQFLTRNREVTAIATCRRKQNGGNFAGALAAELDLLAKAAQAGCQIVDLEVESAEEAKPAQLAKLRAAGAALMVSFHDFMRTRSLEAAADRIAVFKPDYVKVVSTARSLADNLAILRLIEDRSLSAHVVAIAMGEEGIVSRVLGVRAGAAFTFASFSDGTETAPVQVAVRTLLDIRPDYIKLEKALVGEIETLPCSLVIRKLADLGEHFSIPVVAEGVDRRVTAENLWLLNVASPVPNEPEFRLDYWPSHSTPPSRISKASARREPRCWRRRASKPSKTC